MNFQIWFGFICFVIGFLVDIFFDFLWWRSQTQPWNMVWIRLLIPNLWLLSFLKDLLLFWFYHMNFLLLNMSFQDPSTNWFCYCFNCGLETSSGRFGLLLIVRFRHWWILWWYVFLFGFKNILISWSWRADDLFTLPLWYSISVELFDLNPKFHNLFHEFLNRLFFRFYSRFHLSS